MTRKNSNYLRTYQLHPQLHNRRNTISKHNLYTITLNTLTHFNLYFHFLNISRSIYFYRHNIPSCLQKQAHILFSSGESPNPSHQVNNSDSTVDKDSLLKIKKSLFVTSEQALDESALSEHSTRRD